MLFEELCGYFERIEATSKRLEKTEILAELLKKIEHGEVGVVINLALGQLAAPYRRQQFNLAEKMLTRAIAQSVRISTEEVTTLFKSIGDIGRVVQELSSGRDKKTSGRSISELYQGLVLIASDSGLGSQERKQSKLAELLASSSAIEAKYIVRMVNESLRLGFSESTMLDVLSYYASGNKDYSEKLEKAYQMRPDVALLGSEVVGKGIEKAIQNASVVLGVPVIPALAQRLASVDEMIEKMGRVYVEPKLDGTRCVGGYTGVFEKTRGYVSVRELRVGDQILTHVGKFAKVLAKTRRSRKKGERVFAFKTFLGDQFRISEGHPVLVYQEDNLLWKNIEEITDDWVYFPRPKFVGYTKVADEITFTDKAGYSKNVKLNERVMQFLGFWVGDGMSNTSHQMERIGIACNARQAEIVRFYEKIIREELHISEIGHDRRNGVDVIYWRDPVMRKWLCDNFRGPNESGKKIPDWFFGLDKARWKSFLLGWKQADGNTTHSGYKIVTKERQMGMMGVLMSMSFGIPTGLRRIRNSSQTGVTKTYYELIFPGSDQHCRVYEGGYLIKILSKKKLVSNVSHRISLYDIQVEGDESFCVSMASLHNCQIHFSKKAPEEIVEKKDQVGLFQDEKPRIWVKTYTRNLDENTLQFPELMQIDQEIEAESVILDAEAVGYDPETKKLLPFQMTITRKRKHGVADAIKTIPLRFFVFDIMYLNGVSLINKPLSERRIMLEKILRSGNILSLNEQIETDVPEVIREYHGRQLALGLEGVLVKKVNGTYDPGRSGFNWVKLKEVESAEGKLSDTIDCVVMGYYAGRGKRNGFGIGAFLVGVMSKEEQLLTIAKIGTGLTDDQFRELYTKLHKIELTQKPSEYVVEKTLEPDFWVKPEVVVEIAADEITKSPSHTAMYALRFPRLVKFRDDKSVREITTIEEILAMYKNSLGKTDL